MCSFGRESFIATWDTEISDVFHYLMQLISSSYRLNTVMHHFRFHNDRSNNGQNGNIITGDKNTLVHQRSYYPTKISLKELLKLWSKGAKVKVPLKFHKYFSSSLWGNITAAISFHSHSSWKFNFYSRKQSLLTIQITNLFLSKKVLW